MMLNKHFATIVLTIILLTTAGNVRAELPAVFVNKLSFQQKSDTTFLNKNNVRRKKLTAISLAIALGPFGVHRLYLGSDPKVPVIYSITLGAFGILPLADIIAILTTKNIEKFENNSKIVMWIE